MLYFFKQIQFFFLLILLLINLTLVAQDDSQKIKKVELLKANSIEFDKTLETSAKRLIGNVVFRHEDLYMFCDSAWLYDNSNTVKAFNKVRIKQGDSILLIGNYLEYDGNIKLAKMRDSIVLKHNKSFLLTDSLNYDRTIDMAYYFNGGKIYDGNNKLYSNKGYYHTTSRDYFAIDTVSFKNKQYKIISDTLRYNTNSLITFFYGPTKIISETNVIYCENGYYNTNTDEASFSKNAWLQSNANYLKGDSIYYNRRKQYGIAYKNVSIIDTTENINAYGNFAYYYENPQKAMLTDSVMIEYISEKDTAFLHADSVYIHVDSIEHKLIRAFNKVQIYKSDAQARCDSLVYYSNDSILHLYKRPIIWTENSQITAQHIQLVFKDKSPHKFNAINNSFVLQKIDSLHFNQAKCQNIEAIMENKEMKTINLINNCQVLYFIEDEDTKDIINLNNTNSSNMKIIFDNNKVSKIWCYEKPEGKITPIKDLKENDKTLKDFKNLEYLRPKNKNDIFIWIKENE